MSFQGVPLNIMGVSADFKEFRGSARAFRGLGRIQGFFMNGLDGSR